MKTRRKHLLAIFILFAILWTGFMMLSVNSFEVGEAKLQVEAKMDKYINYYFSDENQGTMLQYQIKSQIEYEKAVIPVKGSELKLQINQIDGKYPYSVTVMNKETEYDANTGILTIKEVVDHKYTIVCYYDTYSEEKPERELCLEITGKAELETEDNAVLEYQDRIEEKVTQNIGRITSIECETTDIYNGAMKANQINGTSYTTSFQEIQKVTVSQKKAQERIEIIEKNPNVNYKRTKITKQDMINLLGEEGTLEILDINRNRIAFIDKETEFAEDGTITIHYENEIEAIILVTSKIQNEGILRLEHTKEIKSNMTEDIKTLDQVKGIIGETESYYEEWEDVISWKEAQTNIKMNLDNTAWTNEKQNDIIFNINLNSAEIKYNLFKDASLKIQLPSQVEKVILGSSLMVYGNGLTLEEPYIETDKNGNMSIMANLKGEQTQYQESNLGLTTNIKIPATIILKKNIENTIDKLNLAYKNNYTLDKSTEEGNIEIPLNIKSYNTEQNVLKETIKNIELSKKSTSQEIMDGLKLEVTPVKGEDTLNNEDTIFEGEYVKYKIRITNISNTEIENVRVISKIPEGLVYGELKADYYNYNGEYTYYFDNSIKEKSIEIGTIKSGESCETFYEVQAQDLENGEVQKEIISDIKVYVGETIATNYQINNIIKPAELKMFLDAKLDNGNNRWNYGLELEGKAGEEVTVQIKFPEEFKLKWFSKKEEEKQETIPNDHITVSEDNIVTTKLIVNKRYSFQGFLEEYEIDKNTNTGVKTIVATAKASVNGQVYASNENRIEYEYKNATIVMTSPTEGQKIHYGEEIEYDIAVTNIGGVNSSLAYEKAIPVHLTDFLPEDINPINVTYETWKKENDKLIREEITLDIDNLLKDQEGNKLPNVDIICNIPKDETAHIKIIATAGYVLEDTKIENNATITVTKLKKEEEKEENIILLDKTSNTIMHTIVSELKQDPEDPENPEDPDKPTNPDEPENPENPSEENYTISGTTWIDSNEDGGRQLTEIKLKDIRVILVNMKNENIIDAETITTENGTYRFTNLKSGNYVVLFMYDNNNYTITEYKHNGISENMNSDVFKQEIELFGDRVIVGATDILQVNEDKSNIDMGLIKNKLFDLSLNKSISMVTVQTKQRKKTYNYENAKLAKIDIRAKEIEGAKVTVQYKITVTNEGELEAIVGNIIDYLPEGFRLDTNNEQSWKSQGNNIVVNESIKSQKLPVGESIILTLTATKTMTSDSTGIFTNKAEIGQANNLKQLKDVDSTPGNGIETEDDFSKAEIIISIGTGIGVYISIGLMLLVLLAIALFVGMKKGKIDRNKLSRIFKLSMFAVLFVTIIFMQETKSMAEYLPYDTQFRFLGGVDGIYFEWGPYDWGGTCMNKGIANQDKEKPYRDYILNSEIDTIVYEEFISIGTISLSKGNSNINMTKIDSNNYLFGPFIINCNNLNGYIFEVKDRAGNVVSGVSTCNSSGASMTVTGNATFYLKIPASACNDGISLVKATNTAQVTKKKSQTILIEGSYAPAILPDTQWVNTSGYITEEVEEVVYSSESVEWTNLPGAIEVIKRDNDQENKKLSGVQMRLYSNEIGYNKTATTDRNGYILFDNLPYGYTYYLEEVMTPYYGYSPEIKIPKTVAPGKLITIDAANVKHTGNLKIVKKDKDSGKYLSGVGFKVRNEKNQYLIAVNQQGKEQSKVTGEILLGSLHYTQNEKLATEFFTNGNGLIGIYNILTGTYKVTETTIGDNNQGYELDDGYVSWDGRRKSWTRKNSNDNRPKTTILSYRA